MKPISNKPPTNNPLYKESLIKAEGDKKRAMAIYRHKISSLKKINSEQLDKNEKWPMLVPLLILYSLGTVGVLILVFAYLGIQLNWW